jgi:hypothetical protein
LSFEIDKEKIASSTVLAQHHSEASMLRSYQVQETNIQGSTLNSCPIARGK